MEDSKRIKVMQGDNDENRKDGAALCRLLDIMEQDERKTLDVKGSDYSDATGGNRLANFERIAARYYIKFVCECGEQHRIPVPPRLVLAIYREKHLDAFRTWVCEGELKGEPLAEKLKDDRNYAALARLMDEAE